MGPNTLLVFEDKADQRIMSDPSFVERTKTPRYSRNWYLLPFLVNLALLFRASWQVSTITQNVADGMSFPLPGWMLFATIAICAPPSLVACRLMPDSSIAIVIGGLLTSVGLLWTLSETGSMQIVSFCILVGSGISLSFQAAVIALSPHFLRENVTCSVVTLLLSASVMASMSLLENWTADQIKMLIYFCPVILITSLIPAAIYLHSLIQMSQPIQKKVRSEVPSDDIFILSEKIINTGLENDVSAGNSATCDVDLVTSKDESTLLIVSLLLWLTWGTGTDTTWLSLGWPIQYFSSPSGLPALQLVLCFVLLAVKLHGTFSQPRTSLCRANLASNYMQLGLLGTAGIILSIFPEDSRAFHNHLLFTAGFALQYDDLSDLYHLKSASPSLWSAGSTYKLITYQIGEGELDNVKDSQLLTFFNKMGHLLSLMLLSMLAMLFGQPICNILGYLFTLAPLSSACSRSGLMILSVAAVLISLLRPDMRQGPLQAACSSAKKFLSSDRELLGNNEKFRAERSSPRE